MKKSYLCAFPAVLIWATTVVVKVILTDMPDMQMLCISSAFAFLFLLLFNIKNGSIRKNEGLHFKKTMLLWLP